MPVKFAVGVELSVKVIVFDLFTREMTVQVLGVLFVYREKPAQKARVVDTLSVLSAEHGFFLYLRQVGTQLVW